MRRREERLPARLRVRYETGDTDEWELHERMDLHRLGDQLNEGWQGRLIVGFGVASREGDAPIDYGMVALRMAKVIAWEIDGFVDFENLIGPILEMPGG